MPPPSLQNPIHTLLKPLLFLFIFAATTTSHTSSTTSSPTRSTTYSQHPIPGHSRRGVRYGMATVGLSESMFERGEICGACFELKCVDDLRWCIPGTSIIVSVTNFCAPNYGFTSDGGGKCNPPNKHFVLPIEAFEKMHLKPLICCSV
uniref:Expansin n=1 Tax=Salix viminalis TaxID=40686 RepID=A0A6N2LZC7_SALVM